jgi:Flp pilus assembly protein TadG
MWKLRNDRGAVAVLTAILAGAVLFAFGAFAVDVGSLYSEFRQVQNGADAAAMAVAQSCAKGTCDTTKAATFANANANDGATNVGAVCGTASGLPGCPASTGKQSSCTAPAAGSPPYAQVYTNTRNRDGTNLVPPIFARALPGNASYNGKNVGACARAAYGAPASAKSLGMTLSACEWQAATSNGTTYAPAPPAIASGNYERVIYLHTSTKATHCNAGPAGSDAPGGFGWTDSDSTCTTTYNANTGGYSVDPGTSMPSQCQTVLNSAWTNHPTALLIPVFNQIVSGGTNGTYTLSTIAAFVVTGYYLGGQNKQKSWLPGSPIYNQYPCSGNDRCVSGYFTQATTTGQIGSGNNAGVSVVQLTG